MLTLFYCRPTFSWLCCLELYSSWNIRGSCEPYSAETGLLRFESQAFPGAMGWMLVSPQLRVIWWSPIPQSDNISGGTLKGNEVVRVETQDGLVPFEKWRRISFAPFPVIVQRYSKRVAVRKPGKGPPPGTQSAGTLIWNSPSSRAVRNVFLVLTCSIKYLNSLELRYGVKENLPQRISKVSSLW